MDIHLIYVHIAAKQALQETFSFTPFTQYSNPCHACYAQFHSMVSAPPPHPSSSTSPVSVQSVSTPIFCTIIPLSYFLNYNFRQKKNKAPLQAALPLAPRKPHVKIYIFFDGSFLVMACAPPPPPPRFIFFYAKLFYLYLIAIPSTSTSSMSFLDLFFSSFQVQSDLYR